MKYVPDLSGRFDRRPHYEASELDEECEDLIAEFLRASLGKVVFPIPTDILTKLIERDADELDIYADLSGEGADVEGVTDFFPDRRPRVRLSRLLAEEEWRSNRFRTTLTHEYGHVKFHDPLWAIEFERKRLRSVRSKFLGGSPQQCHRTSILGATEYDWMEWQAGYISGALLMPESHVREMAAESLKSVGRGCPLDPQAPEAAALAASVVGAFDVSRQAAEVRLTKLGYLAKRPRD
jgi:hypothetical protein